MRYKLTTLLALLSIMGSAQIKDNTDSGNLNDKVSYANNITDINNPEKCCLNKPKYSILKEKQGQFKIKKVAFNSKNDDFAPIFYNDQLVFSSSKQKNNSIIKRRTVNNKPFLDLYTISINEENDVRVSEWGKKINSKYHEGGVSFGFGNKQVAITTNYYGKRKNGVSGNLKIEMYELNGESWEFKNDFILNDTGYSVGHPAFSPDNHYLYFVSDMPGGYGGTDLYRVKINSDGSYGKAENLGEKVNTQGDEMFPFFHEEGYLFFSSNGKAGLGGQDIFIAFLKSDLSIGKVQGLEAPVNSPNDDISFILDSEMKKGYFSSNRIGGKGGDDIYAFELLKPFISGKTIKGTATGTDGKLLTGVTINMYDVEGNVIETVTTSEDGKYEIIVESDKTFSLKAQQEDYFEYETEVSSQTEEDEITVDLTLEKDPGLSLYAVVTDNKTGELLEGVKLTIVDNMTGEEVSFVTPATGDYRRPLVNKKLNDRGSYNFSLAREGYFSKTLTYNVQFDNEGQYDVHSTLDFSMDAEVKDLSEMVVINPIKFDYNRYNIREDAAIELDKIIGIMNKYPNMVIELGAHTDCRGSSSYNKKLSHKRAKASAKYIAERISNPDRVYGQGYGENSLLNDCGGNCKNCSDEDHNANRRTEFKVISTGNDKLKVINTSTDSSR